MKKQNSMRDLKIVRVVLSAGATGQDLEKASKLLELVTDRKPQIVHSGPRKRIPAFGVKPNMPLGTNVTVRGEAAISLLNRILGAIDNKLSEKQIKENTFSFGIKEYIDIPNMEYVREIGIRGFNVSVVFERKGVRVKKKKIKRGKLPKRQNVSKQEIIEYMKNKFNTEFEK